MPTVHMSEGSFVTTNSRMSNVGQIRPHFDMVGIMD